MHARDRAGNVGAALICAHWVPSGPGVVQGDRLLVLAARQHHGAARRVERHRGVVQRGGGVVAVIRCAQLVPFHSHTVGAARTPESLPPHSTVTCRDEWSAIRWAARAEGPPARAVQTSS